MEGAAYQSPPASTIPVSVLPRARSRLKRYRGSPTGQTPTQPEKKMPARLLCSARKRLDFSTLRERRGPLEWSNEENAALVEFLCLHNPKRWPLTKDPKFWRATAVFVQQRSGSGTERPPFACRARVSVKLCRQFSAPEEADVYFQKEFGRSRDVPLTEMEHSGLQGAPRLNHHSIATQTEQGAKNIVDETLSLISTLPEAEHLNAVGRLLKDVVRMHGLGIVIPDDFLSKSISAMQNLRASDRHNILYGLAVGLGTTRPDKSDTLIPTKRMPMGLLEYLTKFFTSTHLSQIGACPSDYRVWCETMYNLFGTKWCKIHTGPLWCVDTVAQSDAIEHGVVRDPIKARVNIPAPSVRTIQRKIAACKFDANASIQLVVLDEAARSHPEVWWWVKGDGCDVISGLRESVDHKWSGDVDLGDGKLQALFSEYTDSQKFISNFGLGDREARWTVSYDCDKLLQQVKSDLCDIRAKLTTMNVEYGQKVSSGRTTDKVLHTLSWNVEDLSHLSDEGSQLIVELEAIRTLAEGDRETYLSSNVPRRLTKLRERLMMMQKGVYRFRRCAATHIFVIMISTEGRTKKPYALPVQCIPYASLTDKECRKLMDVVISEMKKRKMKVAGCVTNGEFNSLRCRGSTRPLSVLQIKSDVRNMYSRKGMQTMLQMITPKCLPNGDITAEIPSDAVSKSLLLEIEEWMKEGAKYDDIICRLRPKTVPPGYPYSTWISGKTESTADKLRSVLAQLEFSYRIRHYHDIVGVPFRYHLYVPEAHTITNLPICEREDEGHVFKRIAQCTREGGPSGIQLQRFTEALYDEAANITYTALTGIRKQSVSDAERLLSASVAEFMKRRNYLVEEKYVSTISNWRAACDERGLSELTRSKYNYQLLNYVVEELMPWFKEYDFSHLEVNRDVSRIRGFTREVLNALIANIESREWRRCFIASHHLPVEHPRSSTTDDVECFFSVLRDSVGKDFTVKNVLYAWRHACLEFTKRSDSDLPYYYYTASHDRFYEGDKPGFNEPSTKSSRNPRHMRAKRAESLAGHTTGRTTLPTPGARSVRLTYHNIPVEIPPPPTRLPHETDHAYV